MNRLIVSAGLFAIITCFARLASAQLVDATWSAYVTIGMDGSTCTGVTVCDTRMDSCEITVLACDGPVSLAACLHEGGVASDVESEEWIDVLGCSTDLSRGFPASVDVDAIDLYWITGPSEHYCPVYVAGKPVQGERFRCGSYAEQHEAERNHGRCAP